MADVSFRSMFPTDRELRTWVENELNVMMIGVKGVGKTAICKQALGHLNYRYFSASTMDPWVDFVGVPKEVFDDKGAYLDLIKPKEFRDDEVQALMFDEFNRGERKIKAAAMELIQFGSINNRKFENLKMVWAACNPWDNDKYETEPLDWAQLDRFDIIIELPKEPQQLYFTNMYGELGKSVCGWWSGQHKEVQDFVSPRRLELVITSYNKGLDIAPMLPRECNSKALVDMFKKGSPETRLEEAIKKNDVDAIKSLVKDEKTLGFIKDLILSKYPEVWQYLKDDDKVADLVHPINGKICKKIVETNKEPFELLLNTLTKGGNKDLVGWAKSLTSKTFHQEGLGKVEGDYLTALGPKDQIVIVSSRHKIDPTKIKPVDKSTIGIVSWDTTVWKSNDLMDPTVFFTSITKSLSELKTDEVLDPLTVVKLINKINMQASALSPTVAKEAYNLFTLKVQREYEKVVLAYCSLLTDSGLDFYYGRLPGCFVLDFSNGLSWISPK